MRLERRRHFRQPAGIPARVRLAGPTAPASVQASASDLSPGGTMLTLERLPGWGLDLGAAAIRLDLELDLGTHGLLRCEGLLRRIAVTDSGCEMGVEFAGLSADGAKRLRCHLERSADRQDDAAIDARRRAHLRRRRVQTAVVAAIFLAAAFAISAAVLGALDAVPDWVVRVRSFVRSEIRDAARQAVEEESRREREAPRGPDGSAAPGEQRGLEDRRDR